MRNMQQSGYEVSVSGFSPLQAHGGGLSRGDNGGSPGTEGPSNGDDREWIAWVRSGDEEAAHALMRRLYPTVLKSISARLERSSGREDVIQMVFAKIFHNLDQFAGRAPLEHWASRIAVNTCINVVRSRARRRELPLEELTEVEQHQAQWAAGEQHAEPPPQRDLLEQLLEKLSPDERQVITLLHLEERSAREISRMTGWSVSSIKVRAFRTRRKMRRLWRRFSAAESRCGRG
jgi:RNA polymerase sigma-70 factor (ECF subfamily)